MVENGQFTIPNAVTNVSYIFWIAKCEIAKLVNYPDEPLIISAQHRRPVGLWN